MTNTVNTSNTVNTYGLVVYHKNAGEEPTFHISQRRDTLAYIHFIKGGVPEEKLEPYFARMTQVEKDRILTHSFKDLWTDLFCDKHIADVDHFNRSMNKFERFKSANLLQSAYDKTSTRSIELEWGIPKGRKKHAHEPDLVCAHREYREETRNRCYLEFLDYPPIKCVHPTRNETITYFVARSKFRSSSRHYIQEFGKIFRSSVSDETGNLYWMTLNTSSNVLIPVYQKVLQEVSEVLKTHSEFLLIQDIITKYKDRDKEGE